MWGCQGPAKWPRLLRLSPRAAGRLGYKARDPRDPHPNSPGPSTYSETPQTLGLSVIHSHSSVSQHQQVRQKVGTTGTAGSSFLSGRRWVDHVTGRQR